MTSHNHYPAYQAHLLRMWCEPAPRHTPRWRFSLEEVSTGQRMGFADLDALIMHLLALMEEPPAPGLYASAATAAPGRAWPLTPVQQEDKA